MGHLASGIGCLRRSVVATSAKNRFCVGEGWATPPLQERKGGPAAQFFFRGLLQAFDQVEVAQGSMEAVDIGLAVGRHQDRSDGRDAGGIERGNLFPDGFFSCG